MVRNKQEIKMTIHRVNNLTNTVFYNKRTVINSVDLRGKPFVNNSMCNTFNGCTNLTSVININTTVSNMYHTFYNCTSLTNAPIIPNSVTTMDGSFSGCANLTTIPVIPNATKSLTNTFKDCINLSSIPAIPDSVTEMIQTFTNCTNLPANIFIESEQVTNVSNCFSSTLTHKNVYIPYKYENGNYTQTYNAFTAVGYDNIGTLHGVYLKEFMKPTTDWDFIGIGGESGSGEIIKYIGNKTTAIVPNILVAKSSYQQFKTDVIFNTTFNRNPNIISIDLANKPFASANFPLSPYLPENIVQNSMHSAFIQCSNLQTVTNINQNVTNMYQTFAECYSLVNAPVIPNSVTSLYGTFGGCPSLVNAPVIPNSVTNMSSTFSGCSNLVNAPTIPNSVTDMTQTFMNCTNLVNSPVIPNSVISMYGTFRYCTNLVNVPVIPNSVTDMRYTFANCTNLVNAPSIPNSITNMLETFANCTNLVNAPAIPNSVTNMAGTFIACTNLTNAPVISNSVTNMYMTFSQCSKIIDIPAISNSVKDMYYTFSGCTNLANIPDITSNSITTLHWTFNGCTNLTNAPAIPNSVTNMPYTFNGCTNLINPPVIPNSVTDMSGTFAWCSNLVNTPEIPNSVTNMFGTFRDCNNIVDNVIILSDKVTNAVDCFNTTSSTTINFKDKNVYIPFRYENGVNSSTYNAFISAGYSSTARQHGVILKNLQVSGSVTLTINPTPSDATVTLTADGFVQEGNSITVEVGTTVNWSVSKDGFITQSGTQKVNDNITKDITLLEVPHKLTIVAKDQDGVIISDATITLVAEGYTQEGNSITAPEGTLVTYMVTKEHYKTVSGSTTITNQDRTLEIELIDDISLTTIVTSSSSALVPVGVYKYLMVGGGGSGHTARVAVCPGERGRKQGSGGSGGGSGYVKVGYFSTPGEIFDFTIGAGGTNENNGENTSLTGQYSGLINTANGGKAGEFSTAVNAKGGDGGSGGGAGGYAGQNDSTVLYEGTDGGNGGLDGGNGESITVPSVTISGGIGYHNAVRSYDNNAGIYVNGNDAGTPGGGGKGLINMDNYIKNKNLFLTITEDQCYNYLAGGGGGSHSKMPTASELNPDFYGGAGGGGGGYNDGDAGQNVSSGQGTPGSGGSGAIIYNILDGCSLVVKPTPADANVTLTSTGYTQIGNGIAVPKNTTVNYLVSKTGYDTVTNAKVISENECLEIELVPTMCTLTITTSPAGATVTLTAPGYTQQGNSIRVRYGTEVTYSVTLSGYAPVTGTAIVTEDKEIPISITQNPMFTINPVPADATVTLTAPGYTQEGNSIRVFSGVTVNWTVSKNGYLIRSGSQTMGSVNITKEIELASAGVTLLTSSSSNRLPAGTYRYIVISGAGTGGLGGNLAASRNDIVYGGGGGGSGNVSVGMFTLNEASTVNFVVGEGGADSTVKDNPLCNGNPSTISVGSNVLVNVSGGTKGGDGSYAQEGYTPNGSGGNGYSGGGSGGRGITNNDKNYMNGAAGGINGYNGLSSSFSGGFGYRETTEENTGRETPCGNPYGEQAPATYGVDRISDTLLIRDNFLNATEEYIGQYLEGGSGGAGSNGGTNANGGGGSGGSAWTGGAAATPSADSQGHTMYRYPGRGGNGAILYSIISY